MIFVVEVQELQKQTDNKEITKEKSDTAISPRPVKDDVILNIVKSERDYYQKEYLNMLNHPNSSVVCLRCTID